MPTPDLRELDGMVALKNGGFGKPGYYVLTVYDWAYSVAGIEHFARTPERAERLRAKGIKLTPLYIIEEPVASLLDERDALRAALEPFAKLADDYLTDTVNVDDDTIMAGRMTRRGEEGTPPRVTFADFRRARAALSQSTPQTDEAEK